MITFCIDCKHLHSSAKSSGWYHWLCMMSPHHGINPVTGQNFDPPYRRCLSKNFGSCKHHEAGINCFSPDQFTPPKR